MEGITYKTYTKKQMVKVIKNGFVFIETSLKDNFEIALKDLPDFIMLESERTGHTADLTVYIPGIKNPVLTTCGCYLNKINPTLREEIINRLIILQKSIDKPKKVKIFDNVKFINLSQEEFGLENGEIKNFEMLYGRYVMK